MKLRIAILGTRGIPNHYGGFEQVAASLSAGLVQKGHEVTVYNSHRHPYQQDSWKGVRIVHCFDAEYRMGTAGQFIYDLNCILHSRKQRYDIILSLGYTSSSVWGWLYPRDAVIISNMDGLEWSRTKYTKPVRKFLRYAEKLAVVYSDHLVADAVPIQEYLVHRYAAPAAYIAYGADTVEGEDGSVFSAYGINRYDYYLLMARMEPENTIAAILDGICRTGQQRKILVIGNTGNAYGKRLLAAYAKDTRVCFLGAIYEPVTLHTLKKYSCLYFHGHSVGGTNPSLLEAMASAALVCAHDNPYNKAVLGGNAFYFTTAADVARITGELERNEATDRMISNNLDRIANDYTWQKIVAAYESYFMECYQQRK